MNSSESQNRSHINHLVFIHIPKTAGLSLHAVLEKHFGIPASFRAGNVEDRALFSSLSNSAFKDYRYITGHLSLHEILGKEIDYPLVSVVRNPFDRLVSLLRYYRESDLVEHGNFKFDSVGSFVEHMTQTGQFDMQCWHLSGTHTFEAAVEMINRYKIYAAPLQYYDDFLSTLSGLLGTRLENVRVNVTPQDNPLELTHSEQQLIEPLISEDLKLVDYIETHYYQLKHEFIENLIRFDSEPTSKKLTP